MRRAVIFDMDGVLTDSEPLICAAAMAMFAERGVEVSAADFVPFVGAGENRYIGGVAERHGLVLDLEEAKARTYALYLERVPQHLKAFPGAVALVQACRQAGCLCAVASSADWVKIEANLREIGLDAADWDAVVSGEELEHLKPAPDIFLEAARRLGVPPGDCTVIEDACNGVRAAKAAGMYCLAVASTFPAEQLEEADCVKSTLADVSLTDIMGAEDEHG